ncbi:uncharacterized protein F4807DRAFT_309194 [Annulohypoxylon truncatum]|uniref:uncharacterized protein n=1 Tax=Annulohypoxylon truncatum TaxID=327061 RepID=UPI0020079D4A|nr:uncharacterized protein F4807DRAFT_309194 [Annulohypoxylon truncatum]KAI1213039.1 hypothetical protein F4807DRAFT_309194 [Annulohypoxylon truncatum]
MSTPLDSFARFDPRSQIKDNCEFFVSKYDVVQVIEAKVATGSFVAYAVRSNEKSRDALLCSERCLTVQDAIESLLNKSCEAVQNYITTNGFSYPPDIKKTKLDSSDDEEEEEDDDRVEEIDDDEEEDDDDADVASIVSGRSASSTVALSYWGSDEEAAAMTPASSAGPHASRGKGQRYNSNVPPRPHRSYESSNHRNSNNGGSGVSSNTANYASKRRSKPPPAVVGVSKPPSPRFGPDDSDDDEVGMRAPRNRPLSSPPPRRVKPARTSPKTVYVDSFGCVARCGDSPVVSNTLSTSNSAGNAAGKATGSMSGMGGISGIGNTSSTTSYRPPPPPPRWTGPPMPPPPPPARNAPVPQNFAFAHPHPHQLPQASACPAGVGAGSQPVTTPPLRAPTITVPCSLQAQAQAQPQVQVQRAASLQYKASMPNLSSGSTHNHHQNHNHAQNVGVGPGNSRLYDVRLTIRWPGRGEAKILESARPSVRALQEMAVAYARSHGSAFDNGASTGGSTNADGSFSMKLNPLHAHHHHSPTGSGSGSGNGSALALRACVRRAVFAPGEAYDMSAYRGDDLTKLFNVLSAGGIPRFEVEVEAVAPGQVQVQTQVQH